MPEAAQAGHSPFASAALKAANEEHAGLQSRLTNTEAQLRQRDAQLQEKDAQLQEKDAQLQEKDAQLQEKDAQLQEKDAQLQEKDATISTLKQQIEQLQEAAAALSDAPATASGKRAESSLGADDAPPAKVARTGSEEATVSPSPEEETNLGQDANLEVEAAQEPGAAAGAEEANRGEMEEDDADEERSTTSTIPQQSEEADMPQADEEQMVSLFGEASEAVPEPTAMGSTGTGGEHHELRELDSLEVGLPAPQPVEQLLQFQIESKFEKKKKAGKEVLMTLMRDGRLFAFKREPLPTASADPSGAPVSKPGDMVLNGPEGDERHLLGPVQRPDGEVRMMCESVQKGASPSRVYVVRDGVTHMFRLAEPSFGLTLDRGALDDDDELEKEEEASTEKRKKSALEERRKEASSQDILAGVATAAECTPVALASHMESANLIAIAGAEGQLLAKQMRLEDDKDGKRVIKYKFTTVIEREEDTGAAAPLVLFLSSNESEANRFSVLVVVTETALMTYQVMSGSLDPRMQHLTKEEREAPDADALKLRRKDEAKQAVEKWQTNAKLNNKAESLFKDDPDNQKELSEMQRPLLVLDARAKREGVVLLVGHDPQDPSGRVLELWKVAPSIERRSRTRTKIRDFSGVCQVDWGEHRHWLVATSGKNTEGHILHLLHSETLNSLRTYKLCITSAPKPTRLTAISLPVVDLSKNDASAVLCCGFEDGTVRRFHVADLQLRQLL